MDRAKDKGGLFAEQVVERGELPLDVSCLSNSIFYNYQTAQFVSGGSEI